MVNGQGVQRYYAEQAERLAGRYEGLAFDEVHAGFVALLPDGPARVADIGAGTGRDAAALADRGHDVVAVEPVAAMRESAGRHRDPRITWIADALPALGRVGGVFAFVLVSAVWMHLAPDERSPGMRRLAALLAPGGVLALSLRHGPPPDGRRMYDVPAEETVAQAGACGLIPVLRARRETDLLGRGGVRWSELAFRAPA
ncbi:class I SAM-dependent methyltransferase [Streptomyces sp. RFCAC02]|uniref:class I SAM-dependent methyltransferase n=1 Tax=Streptomyces sp. RFCAC02 TaxID=2499143 RepID=UPI00101FED6A|nr:class I SAM-dependent methyltransferase [Streptomyces sp. RFCAC02]